jgi:hypothetical protein
MWKALVIFSKIIDHHSVRQTTSPDLRLKNIRLNLKIIPGKTKTCDRLLQVMEDLVTMVPGLRFNLSSKQFSSSARSCIAIADHGRYKRAIFTAHHGRTCRCGDICADSWTSLGYFSCQLTLGVESRFMMSGTCPAMSCR